MLPIRPQNPPPPLPQGRRFFCRYNFAGDARSFSDTKKKSPDWTWKKKQTYKHENKHPKHTHTHHTNIPDLSARTFLDLSGSFKPYWKILGPNRIEHRVVFSIHLPWKPKFYMKVLFGIHVTNVNLTGRPNKYLSSHNHGSVKNNLPLQAVMKRCPMFRKSQGLQEEKRLPP